MSKLEPTRTYSNHTATEVLRRMLDENDEYYKTSGNKTWWGRPIDRQTGEPINVFHYQAQPMGEDRLFVELQLATPEQAIAATLGTGTCRNTAPSYLDFLCSECGFVHYHSDENDSGDGNEWHYCPNCGRRIEK